MLLLQHLRVKYPGIFPERLKSVFLKIRERDAGAGALPDFLVIGAQKSGSTSLFNLRFRTCSHLKMQFDIELRTFGKGCYK